MKKLGFILLLIKISMINASIGFDFFEGVCFADEVHRVETVIDGATVKLEGGEIIGLIGVEVPRFLARNNNGAYAAYYKMDEEKYRLFALKAKEFLTELIGGKEVRVVKDDAYQGREQFDDNYRMLVYLYVGKTFVNELVLREGYGHMPSDVPKLRYKSKLSSAEEGARLRNKKIWKLRGL